MVAEEAKATDGGLDDEGFLRTIAGWNRRMAQQLAYANDIGDLSEEHWQVIEYVKDYYEEYGEGPPVMKIGKATGMKSKQICELFPCGVVKGAYRLAGLPRPPGCV